MSRPALFRSTYVYPIDIWLSRGALVLEPNYRGSAGYGEKFRQLNVRNLTERGRLQPIAADPDGTPSAFRIIPPRQLILSVTFDL